MAFQEVSSQVKFPELEEAVLRFWREGGRLRKRYVRRAELAAVRAACEARRRERRELAEAWQHWRQLVAVVREVSR